MRWQRRFLCAVAIACLVSVGVIDFLLSKDAFASPASTVRLGVTTDPWHAAAWSRALGARVSLVSNYIPFGSRRTLAARAAEAQRRHLDLFVTWLPRASATRADQHASQAGYSSAEIASGSQDAYARRFALAIRRFHGTVYLRYAPEFPGAWEPWHADPDGYVRAWRHLHDLFATLGVRNVLWVWSPALPWGGYSFGRWRQDVRAYWPGDGYVDVVDATTVSHNGESVGYFAERVPLLHEFGKPVTLGEVYAPPGLRRSWLPAFAQMVRGMPWISAVVWLDLDPRASLEWSPWRRAFAAL